MNLKTIAVPEDFYKEEIRNGYKVSSQMKKVWAVEIDLVKKLEEVCKKHDIDYSIFYGSMLGCFRSNGFIPWDDDFDVVMTRHDYDILMSHSDEFEYPYFLQNYNTDKEFFKTVATLRNSESTAIIHYDRFRPFNQGIYIDIYVLDTVPDNFISRLIKGIRQKISGGICYGFFYFFQFLELKAGHYIKYSLPTRKMYRKYDRICAGKAGAKGRNCRNYLNYVEQMTYPIDYFRFIEDVQFEWTTVRMINNKEIVGEILRQSYGDDFMLPKNVAPAHGTTYLDADRSYNDFVGKLTTKDFEK
ncbi:MAG TPA: hypothetical protein DCO86_04725 [Spirochaetaceae bacterium]|nr:hypothetical protein [Spirochaetaceae bacterium]